MKRLSMARLAAFIVFMPVVTGAEAGTPVLAGPGVPQAGIDQAPLRRLAPPGHAFAPPAILSGKIITPTVNVHKAPATPGVRFKYSAPATISFANFGFVSPSGQTYYAAFFNYAPVGTQGTLDALYVYGPLSPYAEAGTWTLNSARIIDTYGNETDYDAAQLATMFPSTTMTVVNDKTSDNIVPTVTSGEILTPVVHMSETFPVFGISFSVTDNLSGVGELLFNLQAPDGSGPYTAIGLAEPPILNGKHSVYIDLAGLPTGTWTITGYQMIDVAGNTLTDNNSADIIKLLGTDTFTLAQ